MKKLRLAAVSVLVAMFWATNAVAHHSAAPFDFTKFVTIEGFVKEFKVANPHTYALVTVTDEKGTRDVEYEGHSASIFYRAGFNKDSIKAGDKIAILIAPRRDGGDGGFIHSFTANGITIGFAGLSPSTGNRDANAPAAGAREPEAAQQR